MHARMLFARVAARRAAEIVCAPPLLLQSITDSFLPAVGKQRQRAAPRRSNRWPLADQHAEQGAAWRLGLPAQTSLLAETTIDPRLDPSRLPNADLTHSPRPCATRPLWAGPNRSRQVIRSGSAVRLP